MTDDEFNQLVSAIEEITGDDYIDALNDAESLLFEVGWTNAKALLSLSTGFDVIPTAALTALLDDSDTLILKVIDREKEALRATIYDAMEQGKTVSETASAISATFAEGYHIDGDRRMATDKWSEMVARTELSAAANAGTFALYHEAGVEKVQWLAANGTGTCEECGDADGEVVKLGDDFPYVDVDNAPAHPRCVCTTVPADEDLGDFSGTEEEQKNASRGGYTAEQYREKFGFTHPIDESADGDSE